jgi:hypothetical protein
LFENPFRCRGNWYRANLHAHTTDTDGDLAPADTAEFYRCAGYHILAITDHWLVTEFASERDDFLVIPGAELGGDRARQGAGYHVVGLDLHARGRLARPAAPTAQELVDIIRADGGEAIIAHPYWSGLAAEEITALAGCLAIEVYNTSCDLENARGCSATHWDDLLSLGHDLGALAVDDGHHSAVDHGRAWIMIRAQSLTVEAVMEALRRGRYYASTGPEIRDLRIGDDRIRVTTSPVQSIALVSAPTKGARAFGRRGQDLTRAEFPLPAARYCRIQAMTRDGKTAWSHPVLLATPP